MDNSEIKVWGKKGFYTNFCYSSAAHICSLFSLHLRAELQATQLHPSFHHRARLRDELSSHHISHSSCPHLSLLYYQHRVRVCMFDSSCGATVNRKRQFISRVCSLMDCRRCMTLKSAPIGGGPRLGGWELPLGN